MHSFTIRDIENLTGIKAHTLRIWEQRYGLCPARRRDSNHRFYDNDDLKRILRVNVLYKQGFKISRIAAMEDEEILGAISRLNGSDQYESVINQLIECSIDLEETRFNMIAHRIIAHMGLEKSLRHVLFPYLERIGLLWLTNHVIPAQEHFVSYLIQKKIITAIDGLDQPAPKENTNILLFTPEGEEHEIPLLLTHYLLKKNGIPSVYFGKNVSVEALKTYCDQKLISHLYLHVLTHFSEGSLEEYLRKLCGAFPDIQVVIAGEPATEIDFSLPNLRTLSREEIPVFASNPGI